MVSREFGSSYFRNKAWQNPGAHTPHILADQLSLSQQQGEGDRICPPHYNLLPQDFETFHHP